MSVPEVKRFHFFFSSIWKWRLFTIFRSHLNGQTGQFTVWANGKQNSRRCKPKFSKKKFPGRFLSIQLCSLNFPEFSVEWFAFRKFTSFRNFWKLFLAISVALLPLVPNFRKFWLNWKRLLSRKVLHFIRKHPVEWTVPFAPPSDVFRTNGKRSDCHSKIFRRNDLRRNVPSTFWKWFVNSTQPKVCFSTFEF